jgi:phospholipid/cholesterol/gamma-HCH transport system substrate-binding protein
VKHRRALVGVVIFAAIALTAGMLEVNTLAGPATGVAATYHAIFGGADGVSGLQVGDSVRVAGVPVGRVTDEHLIDAGHAEVTFTANHDQTVSGQTWAVVRYANLTGARFLALTRSGTGSDRPIPPGATIPQSRTAPALSLTDLFNGFEPLFSAISPQEVNDLTGDILNVLQGEGETLQDLLAKVALFTANLNQRDAVFSKVLDTMSALLGNVAAHDNQLARVLTTLNGLTGQLHADGPGIADSLTGTDALIGSVGGLLGQLEDHNLPGDMSDLNSLTGVVAANTPTVRRLISGFVTSFADFDRVSQHGNWLTGYVCNYTLTPVGKGRITGSDIVNALASVLPGKGISTQSLAGLAVPAPVNVPGGPVGPPGQTKVCS